MDIADWIQAGLTFLAVLVALFKEDITRKWRRPDLKASIRPSAPDRVKTKIYFRQDHGVTTQGDCYYLRIWVENEGKRQAKDVEVFAAELQRCVADGHFERVGRFLPMDLTWTHSLGKPGSRTHRDISPKMGKHCDLGYILKPAGRQTAVDQGFTALTLPDVPDDQTVLALTTEKKPSTLGHLIGPGEYRLKIEVAAANQKPVPKNFKIVLSGAWYDDETKMLSEGIRIEEL
jgi:hypothetical protein